MSTLFTPFQLRDVLLKNRIVVSPMCQYSAEDGFSNDWHLVHLGSRAVGGAGLIFTEATAVTPEGRISPADLGIWKDEHIPGLKRITDFIHAQGSVAGIQLAHAGRKGSKTPPWTGDQLVPLTDGGWHTLAPSPVAFGEGYDTPQELTTEGIAHVVACFKAAAARALKAGFKVIEIHGAHGYLIHEFLSPLCNHRIDQYGGSFDNRILLVQEIVAAIRTEWPEDLPLLLRISASDWVDTGWTVDDSVLLAQRLKGQGVDLMDCSSGAIIPGVKIPAGPGYQVPFASAVRAGSGMPTGAVGVIVSPQQAEDIIAKGDADLIFMAREMLRDPYFPLHAATTLGYDVVWPQQYDRAKRK